MSIVSLPPDRVLELIEDHPDAPHHEGRHVVSVVIYDHLFIARRIPGGPKPKPRPRPTGVAA